METEKIAYFDKLIQNKLENLPRAIEGKASIEVLEKICRELRWLKEAKEKLLIYTVSKSFYCDEENYCLEKCTEQCMVCKSVEKDMPKQ
jgi:hypothetical protein